MVMSFQLSTSLVAETTCGQVLEHDKIIKTHKCEQIDGLKTERASARYGITVY